MTEKTLFFTVLLPLAALSLVAAGHALMNKREPRAALGWVLFCLFVPAIGAISYYLFGINRVQQSAKRLQLNNDNPYASADISEFRQRRTSQNNTIQPLFNGDVAYPEMLAAIGNAQDTVYLSQYIFESKGIGRFFVERLGQAVKRGVEVRVLVDGVGAMYGFTQIARMLRRAGVPTAVFLPLGLRLSTLHVNLRNHRKLLIIDGHDAFVGGMNIRQAGLVLASKESHAIADTMYVLKGPVVAELTKVFARDWQFSTGSEVPIVQTSENESKNGTAECRVTSDGPNNAIDSLALRIQLAISFAQKSIRIQTPYFLPSSEIISALQVACLRGVSVEVFLPARNNLPYVHWATRHMLWQLLQYGVSVVYSAGPFDHSKVIVIDDSQCLIGSANLDPRSLRLNFEIGVEVWDQKLANRMNQHLDSISDTAYSLHQTGLNNRSLPIRIRDATAWLFSPYF